MRQLFAALTTLVVAAALLNHSGMSSLIEQMYKLAALSFYSIMMCH